MAAAAAAAATVDVKPVPTATIDVKYVLSGRTAADAALPPEINVTNAVSEEAAEWTLLQWAVQHSGVTARTMTVAALALFFRYVRVAEPAAEASDGAAGGAGATLA